MDPKEYEHAAYTAVRCAGLSYRKREQAFHHLRSWQAVWKTMEGAEAGLVRARDLLHRTGVTVFLRDDDDAGRYPPLLRETPLAPHGLFVRGAFTTPEKAVAIVGTRTAREDSCAWTESTAAALARRGYRIVSGMAFGIDAAAHRGALSVTGGAGTLAVTATGPDICYPPRHYELYEKVAASGGIVSEYPPGTEARPHYFIERNRIIAGLVQAVVVVQAPARSGALATARFALEANRDVLVVPGAADDPQFAGSNGLIREGATLVRNVEDVLESLGESAPIGSADAAHYATASTAAGDQNETVIINLLETEGALPIDKIVELSHLSTHIVSRTLTLLVFNHAIKENSGRFALAQ